MHVVCIVFLLSHCTNLHTYSISMQESTYSENESRATRFWSPYCRRWIYVRLEFLSYGISVHTCIGHSLLSAGVEVFWVFFGYTFCLNLIFIADVQNLSNLPFFLSLDYVLCLLQWGKYVYNRFILEWKNQLDNSAGRYVHVREIYAIRSQRNLDFIVNLSLVVCCCQGIVIGTGENSEFGEVFKMMQAEEVSLLLVTPCVIVCVGKILFTPLCLYQQAV